MTIRRLFVPILVAIVHVAAFDVTNAQSKSATGFLDRTIEFQGLTLRYQVYVPSNYSDQQPWPVILFLHGAGERGADGLSQTQVGLPSAIRQKPSRYPAIVVMPQAPTDSIWTGVPAQAAMAALERTMKEYRIDPDRVYLTGLSMGGNGTWYLANRYASKFAAIAPICGWIMWDNPWTSRFETVLPRTTLEPSKTYAASVRDLPVWIFHGEEDPAVPVMYSRNAFAALQAAGVNVKYTELPGIGHNSWDAAYGSTMFTTWLFSQRRNQ